MKPDHFTRPIQGARSGHDFGHHRLTTDERIRFDWPLFLLIAVLAVVAVIGSAGLPS